MRARCARTDASENGSACGVVSSPYVVDAALSLENKCLTVTHVSLELSFLLLFDASSFSSSEKCKDLLRIVLL